MADPAYRSLVLKQADLLVPEGEMKWSNVAPTINTFDFTRADIISRLAKENGRKLRGHTLCWHQSMPGWFASLAGQTMAARKAYENFVASSARVWKGLVSQWDVANEILANKGDGVFRDSPLQRLYGDRLLDVAFGTVREQDSQAELYYNDFGFEQEASSLRKRRNLLTLLESLKSRKIPIDGIGLQTHLFMSAAFDANAYSQFLDEIGAMGLKVMITELDVDDHVLTSCLADRNSAAASIIKDLLQVAFSKPFVKGLCTWGITSRYSWLNDYGTTFRRDLQPMACLPYDTYLVANPIHAAISDAFSSALPYQEAVA